MEPAGGGFINFYLDQTAFVPHTIDTIESSGDLYGRPEAVLPERLLIEHTSVNPNKEWHVGHLRNAVIGDVLVRLARLAGHQVEVQNYIDDTGRQAAEAIYALQLYGRLRPDQPSAPELLETRAPEKVDQFVGELYVRLNGELGSDLDPARKHELESGVGEVLHEMETGKYRPALEAIVRAQLQTALRIGARYDMLVWESDVVRAHLLDEALALLRASLRVYVPDEGEYNGALVIEMPSKVRDEKGGADEAGDGPMLRVLVRSNGLPTYTGKDVAYMLWKFGLLKSEISRCHWLPDQSNEALWTTCPDGEPFVPRRPDLVINVVAEHQTLQQQTVIEGLGAAGFEDEARRAHHLSYGMVSQAEGRISGRKGSGIAADDVLDQATAVATERVKEKRPEATGSEVGQVAEAIAVGAVRYLMVQYGPIKPIVFDIDDVVSFEGNTGLYIQYAIVRMSAVLRKAAGLAITHEEIDSGNVDLLTDDAERRLVLKLGRFPTAVEDANRTLAVNLIADYGHTLASEFSQFYRDCPILQAEPALRLARLRLLRATRTTLSNAAQVIGIPVVEQL